MKGYESRINELGFCAVSIHYSADPEKDFNHKDPEVRERAEKWFEEARRAFPDPMKWAQEMELNWWVSAGTRVYPQFDQQIHTKDVPYRNRKQSYRSWDFGWLTPACLIAQIDPEDRLAIHYEVVGKNQTTREFAQQVIDVCAQKFPNHYGGYRDFCDPAGQQASSTASERSEVRDVEILKGLGIFPTWEYGWSRKDGRSLVHQLLATRLDDTPGLYVSSAGCPVLLQGFLGKYVYPAKKGGAAHDEPDESNHPWADAMACLRYLVTGLYTHLGLRRPNAATQFPPKPGPAYTGYGTPVRKKVG